MNIIIAAGALKHSLSAPHAAAAIARGIARSGLDAHCRLMPIADGGNGTLDAFLMSAPHRWRTVEAPACDPLMRSIGAAFLSDGVGSAVVEMAQASGLELLTHVELAPLRATTYGTGQLLTAALDSLPPSTAEVILGLGGSATTDGGAGCLQALGVRFFDSDGIALPDGIGGGDLHRIARIDVSGIDPRWGGVRLVIASDVESPAVGATGAAALFAPQKGASPSQVGTLDTHLNHYFGVIAAQLGVDVRAIPGGGAAGAFAAGMLAIFGERARITSGIDLILAAAGFDDHLATCDLVITSEGRIDGQTLHGKGPLGVAQRAAARAVPTVALVGGIAVDEAHLLDSQLHDAGIWAVLPIVPAPMSLDAALRDADQLMEAAAVRLGYLLRL